MSFSEGEGSNKELPPIVRRVPDPPVPNRAHTEMKKQDGDKQKQTR